METISENKTPPSLAVVIPVYNAEDYLDLCVHSVLNQNYPNLKIYLINDGSVDNSGGICDNYANKYDNIQVLHKSNGGAASARNLGLSLVSPETQYLLFLDADDTLVENSVIKLVKMAENTGTDIVIPDRYYKKTVEDNKEKLTFLFPKRFHITDAKLFATEVMMEQGRGWRSTAQLYRFDLIRKNKILYPEGYTAEDYVFNLEVMKYATKISFLTYPTLVNLKHKKSVTATFKPNFVKTILFLDRKSREFLISVGYSDFTKAEALLLRNTVVYLISIMSQKTIPIEERKKMAGNLLENKEIKKNIPSKRISPPYFSNKLVRLTMPLFYLLIQNKRTTESIWLLSLAFR